MLDRSVIDSYLAFEGGEQLVKELLTYFKARVPERIEAVREAARNHQSELVAGTLHALKNSFLNVGARGVAQNCQNLEDRSRELKAEEILEELKGLDQSFHKVLEELKSYSL